MKSKKAKPSAKKKKYNPDQTRALIAGAFVLIGLGAFLAGAQAQKVNHDSAHKSSYTYSSNKHAHYAQHDQYSLPDDVAVPGVKLRRTVDTKGGYNVFLDVTNFTFAPESAGKANVDGQGHAHLYVDDVKIARLYGTAYYLDTHDFSKGQHVLKVMLTTNDHKDIVKNGTVIEATDTFVVD